MAAAQIRDPAVNAPALSQPVELVECGDSDADGCDDCVSGVFDPLNDGVDLDGDGRCDPPPLLLGLAFSLPQGSSPVDIAVATSPGDVNSLLAICNYGSGTISIVSVASGGEYALLQTLPVGSGTNSQPQQLAAGPSFFETGPVDLRVRASGGLYLFSRSGSLFQPVPSATIPGSFTHVAQVNLNPNSPRRTPDTILGGGSTAAQSRLGDGSGTTCNTGGAGQGLQIDLVKTPPFEYILGGVAAAPYRLLIAAGREFEPGQFVFSGHLFHGSDQLVWSGDSNGPCYTYTWNGWAQQATLTFLATPTGLAFLQMDLVAVAHSNGLVSTYALPGSLPQRQFRGGSSSIALTTLDFDGDSRVEFGARGSLDGEFRLFKAVGANSFLPWSSFQLGSPWFRCRSGDLNRDGRTDLLAANSGTGEVRVWYNNIDGNLEDCNNNRAWDRWDILSGASRDQNGDGVPDECAPPALPGDLNCDGAVTLSDIAGFVLAVASWHSGCAAYNSAFPGCDCTHADLNADGAVTVGDIGPFVQRLLEGS